MRCIFCKALDRPVNIFGLKGKWITVFLVMAGACVFLAFIVGFMMTTGTGISVAIIGGLASFMIAYVLQGKTSHKDLLKVPLKTKSSRYIKRRETLCRIMYSVQDEPSWFADSQRRRERETIEI